MHWGLWSLGFGLGTFKFLFAHWTVYLSAVHSDSAYSLIEIFASVTLGAWFSMSIFYFASELLMKRAKAKRLKAIKDAHEKGIELTPKRKFTRMNRTIIWIKHHIGIYGVTFLAPLFLSVPIGSIICAKFYGSKKRTFPLMLIFTASYSAIMCLWIFLAQ
ncbi:MAG: hypothetical protein R2780_15340 [Crocinitomicaceae bacterium]|nr:hypothetical protein [Crocinitomicaceae bacterium]